MFCPTCNQFLPNNDIICPHCGNVTTSKNESYEEPLQNMNIPQSISNNNTDYYSGRNTQMSPSLVAVNNFLNQANTAQTMGILSIFFGWIFSVITWVKLSSLKKITFENLTPQENAIYEQGKKKMKTAKVLSIIPVVLATVAVCISIITGLIIGAIVLFQEL